MSKKKFNRAAIGADKFFKNTGINLDIVKDKINLSSYEKTIIAGKAPEMIAIDDLRPAPKDWNFFPPVPLSKKIEMVESIQQEGLFTPIIVWKNEDDDRYMILAGHNRVNAYKTLQYEDLTDGLNQWEKGDFTVQVENPDPDYLTIPAFVIGHDEITEDTAKTLIIDSNYVARPDDKSLMPNIVKHRMTLNKGKNITKIVNELSKDLNISKTKVFEDATIANDLIEELQEKYYSGEIFKKQALILAGLPKEVQNFMVETYREKIDKNTLRGFKRSMLTKADIDEYFKEKDETLEKEIAIQYSVPEHLEKQFKADFSRWARRWIKRNL